MYINVKKYFKSKFWFYIYSADFVERLEKLKNLKIYYYANQSYIYSKNDLLLIFFVLEFIIQY